MSESGNKENVLPSKEIVSQYIKDFLTSSARDDFDKYIKNKEETLKILLDIFPEEKEVYTRYKTFLENSSFKDIREMQEIVRSKYGLPFIETRTNDKNYDPIAYLNRLKEIAEKNGISIKPQPPSVGIQASFDPKENIIYINFNPNTPYTNARFMEHELVHAMQYKKYPQMTLSEQEFETNLINLKYFEDGKNLVYYSDTNDFSSSVLYDLILNFQENHPECV